MTDSTVTSRAPNDDGTVTVTFSVTLPKTNTLESVAEAFEVFVDHVKRSDGYPDRLLGDIPDTSRKWVNPNA